MSRNLTSSFPQFNLEMPNSIEHIVYVFDSFKLDRARLMLYRGEAEVTLPPKAVETLAILVENRGEIVSKDDLIEAVWKDAFVEDSNLSHYLYVLRKALGARNDGKPYIETLRRRGYRFNGDTRLLKSANGSAAKRKEDRSVDLLSAGNQSSSRILYGQHSNVVGFSEWKGSERAKDERNLEVVQTPTASRSTGSKTWLVAGAFLVLLALSAAAGSFLYSRNSAALTQPAPEITISRLTNGIEPMGATISPDGKYFVYHESGPAYRLWLQQTGYSGRVEIIPASKKALCCTAFSPDGEFVYYLATDSSEAPSSLFRVPTLGGPAEKLLTDIDSAPSFSPGGEEIIFSRYDRQKDEKQYVIKASDGSGDERIVYAAPGSFSNGPAWAPDGKSIVFAKSLSGEAGDYRLMILGLADGSLDAISDESWDACHRIMWRADGLGFYFVGTKKNERLTARRDQLYYVSYPAGISRRITTDPTSRQQTDSLGVTNDGSVLTVPYNRASQIWVMNANGDSRSARQLTSGISDGRAGVVPLADGRLAFVARVGDNTNIFVMNEDGSEQKPLLADSVMPDEPRSSRGSPYLVFSIYNWPYSHLFRANADGSEMTQLTFGESREIDSSVSNDGNWVAYGSLAVPDKDEDISLWKVSISGGEPIRLKQNNCLMPHFSPDDSLLSCVEDQKTIHILSAVDGASIKSFPVTSLAWLNSGARWTPDGKAIAYIVTKRGVSNIWLQPIDGSNPRPLTDFNTASIYNFNFSTDGSRIFLARGQQIRDAMLIQNIK